MQIFEYPFVIMSILILAFVLFASVGIYFAAKGIRVAGGKSEKSFVSIKRLENSFDKSARAGEDRCVFYISLLLDNFRNLYSEAKTRRVFIELQKIMLDSFTDKKGSALALYDEKAFVAFSKWSGNEARTRAEGCLENINKCLSGYGALNVVDVRIGSFLVYGTNLSFDDAIDRAKKACVLAKNEKMSYAEWNLTSGKALDKKIKIENNIEKEINNNHFFLEYQPVIDAKTKKIIGAEVLSRLNSETDGVVSPGTFLSAVNSVGINDKFDYYIFEKNCKWISNDKQQREPYKYTINFSRATLSEPQFPEKIFSIAEKYGLSFSCLAVEILEDKNLDANAQKQMVENLATLKSKGISVLLDDFGSGYTTFGDLQNLDVSIVKIDKAITQNSTTETGFIILKNIIRTSKDIGFKTLCEGIETKEQEQAAIAAGCDLLQGFYYYKPMSVAQLEKIFDKNQEGEN